MRFWTLESIGREAGGVWLQGPGAGVARGLTIDSREVRDGQVFVAIRGERTDGHLHLAAAARAGASMAMVTDEHAIDLRSLPAAFGVLRVDDARAALGRLAAAWRDELAREGVLVVGVTGSAGKTTTTRLIGATLAARWSGHHSPKSFNNSLGVPLTLLNAGLPGSLERFVVCEIGTSHPGEIDALARIVRPDAAVITSIGTAHAEFLGSQAGIAREKTDLLRQIRPGGVGIVTADSPPLEAELARRPIERGIFRVGRRQDSDVRVAGVETHGGETRVVVDGLGIAGERFAVNLLGEHNGLNASVAVAVGRWAGLTIPEIREGLAFARAPAMRLEPVRVGSVLFINDAYNANPESMNAAIGTIGRIEPPPGGRRVLVLGDMLELGAASDSAHRGVARAAKEGGFELTVGVGPAMSRAIRDLGGAGVRTEDEFDDAAAARVAGLLRPGDVVLLKGSRGTRVERVLEARRRSEAAGPAEPKAGAGVGVAR